MHDRILYEMRQRIRFRRYVVTLHAVEEMDDDSLTVFDLENIVLTGHVVERQKDRISEEWKYLVFGDTINAQKATVVARLGVSGQLVILTVFREGED